MSSPDFPFLTSGAHGQPGIWTVSTWKGTLYWAPRDLPGTRLTHHFQAIFHPIDALDAPGIEFRHMPFLFRWDGSLQRDDSMVGEEIDLIGMGQ